MRAPAPSARRCGEEPSIEHRYVKTTRLDRTRSAGGTSGWVRGVSSEDAGAAASATRSTGTRNTGSLSPSASRAQVAGPDGSSLTYGSGLREVLSHPIGDLGPERLGLAEDALGSLARDTHANSRARRDAGQVRAGGHDPSHHAGERQGGGGADVGDPLHADAPERAHGEVQQRVAALGGAQRDLAGEQQGSQALGLLLLREDGGAPRHHHGGRRLVDLLRQRQQVAPHGGGPGPDVAQLVLGLLAGALVQVLQTQVGEERG